MVPELLLMSASRSVLLLDWPASPRSRWRQNWAILHLAGYILIPKRRNSSAFLRERKEQCWGPCLVQCPALSDLRECHCQNQSSAIFFFMEGKNTSVTELPACALTKGESRWKVFITLGIWDSLQLFCKELLSFSISRFLYPFWGQAAEKNHGLTLDSEGILNRT